MIAASLHLALDGHAWTERSIDETLQIARERFESTSQLLAAQLATDDASAAGGFATCAVDECAALREAREARSKEVDALLRKHERRAEALRGTRMDKIPTDGQDGMGESRGGPSCAALVAAEKGLREVDSAAAFELEQELWRGGLRGEALQERLAQAEAIIKQVASTRRDAQLRTLTLTLTLILTLTPTLT